jgi:hypothetical protein
MSLIEIAEHFKLPLRRVQHLYYRRTDCPEPIAERLTDISDEDAMAEGARKFDDLPSTHPYGQDPRWSMETPVSTDQCLGSARMAFANYWEKINGLGSWHPNTWVWVIEFKMM